MLRKHVAGTSAAIALVLAAVPAVAFAATAGEPPTPYAQARQQAEAAADPDEKLVQALSRDLGITAEQAQERLVNETAAANVEPLFRNALGAAYGGLWVTGPTSTLMVATSDAAKQATIRDLGGTPVLVSQPLAALEAAKARLDQLAKRMPRSVPAWYVDVQANKLVVLAQDPAAARRVVAAGGVDQALVQIQQSGERPVPLYDVRGGDAYYMGGGGRCSVGFAVTKPGSQGGFVTAGHCGTVGQSTSGYNRVAQGTFRGSSFPGNDYAWVEVNSQWTPTRYVNAYSQGLITITGSQQAVPGASVCRSGSTTQYHCGTIQQHNTSVTYPQGTVTGVTRTTVCAEPGDSGGSYFSGSQAQGVTSGGSGNCSSGGTTYYQPVNEILSAYGLSLVASGGPGPTPSPTPTSSNPPGGTWAPWTAYAVGAQVTYGGATYRCLQAHTSQPGWEPPNVPALWQQV
ncbi:carbohydrate-binding protein [Thermoactinospora rubra]|uniref:carbohydrate-binding protein n=1 Tax=Thermoactinospora rubra TaxID=1088767 RepID=UPI000A1107D7|nr:carbohydrate-binding protein [Thermoactinospora rubra]